MNLLFKIFDVAEPGILPDVESGDAGSILVFILLIGACAGVTVGAYFLTKFIKKKIQEKKAKKIEQNPDETKAE